MNAVLEVRDLRVRFATESGELLAVDGVDLEVGAGECIGLVGESGSGKSQLFHAVMGVLAANGRATGSVRFENLDLLNCRRRARNSIRGARLAMIFQDPMTSLTPHLKIGAQIIEMLTHHRGLRRSDARARARHLLEQVHIADAGQRLDQYPHELSGGMLQRTMIAMALACEPALLIADEPTTALDVTIQAQLLDLFRELRRKVNTAIVLISHDLGVVAGLADRVAVMYAGRIVESAPVDELFGTPLHPYTAGLLRATPRLDAPVEGDLPVIPGQPPPYRSDVRGCAFLSRCSSALGPCSTEDPLLLRAGQGARAVACHNPCR